MERAIEAGWVQRSPNGRPVLSAYPPQPCQQPVEFDPGDGHVNIALEAILEKILGGELRPNETVNAKRLSEELDVSMASVREALESLSSRGVLNRQPRRGWRVTILTRPEVKDVFRLRLCLEPLIVRYAARHVGDALLDELSECNVECDRSAPQYKRRQADYFFHRRLAEVANRRIMLETLEPLLQRLFMNPIQSDKVNDSIPEHQALLDALREGDGELAADQMRQHLKLARKRYLEYNCAVS